MAHTTRHPVFRTRVRMRTGQARLGRGARLFRLGILAIACAAPHNQLFAQAVRSLDTAIFSAVLRALVSDTSFTVRPIVADPRPLLSDDTVTSIQLATLASVPAAEINARRAAMRELGVKSGDAVFPPRCGGRLVLPAGPSDLVHAGCPSTSRLLVAVGLPRAGDGTKDVPINPCLRTVRVIMADIAPNGISADIRDYVLEGAGPSWRVLYWKRLGFVE